MMLSRLAMIALLGLVASCSLWEGREGSGPYLGSGPTLELKVKKFHLENGLKLLVIENDILPIFSYYTFYDIGGRHEREGTTGATHFLEHMMFKGSKKYGPQVFDDNIEKSGGSNNAYTNFDSTVYYENLPKEYLEMAVDMEADRMENLLLIPESVETERNIIFEERKMRYENSPQGKLFLAMGQAVFEGTPYGGSVIGEVKDLKKLTRENLLEFYRLFYRPNNTVIVIAGAVKAEEVFSLVKEKMGHMKPSQKLVEYKKEKDNPALFTHRAKYNRHIKISSTNPLPLFTMAFKGVKIGGRKGFTLDLLSSILGDGESSYFSEKFVKSGRPSMSSVTVANYTLKHNGTFFIMGQLTERATPNQAEKMILKELDGICEKAVTERSLQKDQKPIPRPKLP